MEKPTQVCLTIFPVLVLLLLEATEGFVTPLQKTASANVQNTSSIPNVTLSSRKVSIPANKAAVNSSMKMKGCKNCTAKSLSTGNIVNVEYDMRIELIKQQILQSLHMSQPPKINRKHCKVPPPLLKKFQEEEEAKKRQQKKDEQREEIATQVIMLGNKVSLANCSKCFARKVKFTFHVSDKVYTKNVKTATLWVYIPKSKLRRSGIKLTIRNVRKNTNQYYVISKNVIARNGGWITVDVKRIVQLWKQRELTRNVYDTSPNQTMEIACTNCKRMSGCVVDGNNETRPFLVVDLHSKVKTRKKRSISCRPGIKSCCLQELYVSFAEMGWDNWILIPEGFNVNYCTGSCYGHILPVHSHSGLLQKVALQKKRKDMAPCCSPTKLAALSILYFDPYENIFQQNIEKMTVQECGCS